MSSPLPPQPSLTERLLGVAAAALPAVLFGVAAETGWPGPLLGAAVFTALYPLILAERS